MNRNRWARQAHRSLSVVFTAAVVVNVLLNVVPLADEELAVRVGLLALLPLALLLITGLYLFVLPYASRNDHPPRSDS